MSQKGKELASSSSASLSSRWHRYLRDPLPSSFLGIAPSSADQFERLQGLLSRPMLPTRFIDQCTLCSLGLSAGVHKLFSCIGWDRFLFVHEPTYCNITLEFLSSLHVYDLGFNFRAFNLDYSMTFVELNDYLHFLCPDRGSESNALDRTAIYNSFRQNGVWQRFSRFPIFPYDALSSLIIHPCYRFAHIFLANTIFARQDISYVSLDELFFLYAMSHDRLHGHVPLPISTAHWIIQELLSVANSTSGTICCGGLITLILKVAIMFPPHMPELPGPTLLDREYLLSIGMITPFGHLRHVYLYGPYCTPCAFLPPEPSRAIPIRSTHVPWEFYPDPCYSRTTILPPVDPPDWYPCDGSPERTFIHHDPIIDLDPPEPVAPPSPVGTPSIPSTTSSFYHLSSDESSD